MRRRLLKLTRAVEAAAFALTKRYRPKQLHSLRVTIRRIRSTLKQINSRRARRFRKTWRAFASVTNNARDWDVFLNSSRKLLSAEDYRAFRKLNNRNIEASHESVKVMLRSARWKGHLLEWKKYLKRPNGGALAQPGRCARSGSSVEQALAAAGLLMGQALASDDDHSWHKFRIAVKHTRYVAEGCKSNSARIRNVVASCKSLQDLLGGWHDTVVQLRLLDSLESAAVHDKLRTLINQARQHSLTQIRAMLETQSIFAAAEPRKIT
jgi:CHAD domain-containing protein